MYKFVLTKGIMCVIITLRSQNGHRLLKNEDTKDDKHENQRTTARNKKYCWSTC